MTTLRNGTPLGQAKNFMDAWRDAFNTPERDINLVMGIHGDAAPFLFQDTLWERYKIGQQYEVDGESKSAATRNVFTSAHAVAATLVTAGPVPAMVVALTQLQEHGVKYEKFA